MRCHRSLLLLALFLTAVPAQAGGPFFRGGSFGFGLGFYPPSYYGYPLDDMSAGYYGGGRYREYYSYGRGYGLANFPGPVPGPMYRQEYNSIQPPKRLPPAYPPPAPPEHPAPGSLTSGPVALIIVQVPADAEIWLEGTKMKQTGATRLFVSPTLTPGARYGYAIRARWQEDGREMEQTQEIVVQAGERLTVRFPAGPELESLPKPRLLPRDLEP